MSSRLYYINSNSLIDDKNNEMVTIDTFKFLTGKNINFEKRPNKVIIVWRLKGHIYISDARFIQGEKYSPANSKLVYRCEHVNEEEAILTRNNSIEVLCIKPLESSHHRWKII